MTEHRPSIPPLAAIPFGILAVSTASIFIRYAQQSAPSLVIAAYRLSLASLALAPLVWFKHRSELSQLGRKQLLLGALSGIFLAIHFATWITSLEFTTVASSVVLVSTSPLWVALLAPWFLKEPLTRPVLIGLSITLAGGVIVGLSDSCVWASGMLTCPSWQAFLGGNAFLGDLLALAGALAGAGYLLIGRRLRKQTSLMAYIFVVYGFGALTLISLTIGAHLPFTGYPPTTYLWLILLALVPQLLGHSTFNWALRYLSAAFVAITLLGEPIGSTILAYFLLAETPTILKVVGAILILSGIAIASRKPSPSIE